MGITAFLAGWVLEFSGFVADAETQSEAVQWSLVMLAGVMPFLGFGAGALFFAGGGSIIEMINRVGSWFYGSLLGIFVMALFFRRASDLAGALGLCGGMAAVVLVHNTVKVQFLWYNVVGLVGVLLVGGLVAAVRPRR